MAEIIEEIYSGFCRTCNQGRTVTCEFEEKQGKMVLQEVDCMYEKCLHRSSCQIAKQIQEFMNCS
ncbi:MAG: hypothetical protein KH828_05055 [Clostridiales bacterium]|nr:hypothetical protein [Clostridiales bacterium]